MDTIHYRIEDIILDISMGPFGSDIKKEVYTDSGIPVLNGSNLQGYELNEDSFGYVTEEKADSLNKANAHRGDMVITHRGTIGQIVYIPQNSKFNRYVISQSQFRVTCNTDIVLPEYLTYYFHTREGQHKLLSNASQVGVPALARASTTFRKLEVDLPSVEIQKKIMDIILGLQQKIAINCRICENLEAQAQALFKHWFIDFAPFKDGKFVESELGMIPEGWRVGRLEELGDIVGGATPSKAEESYYTSKGIAWLTPKDLSNKRFKFTSRGEIDLTQEGYNSCSAKLMPKGSVLFSSRAPIGYLTIAKNDICTNQGFKSVVPQYAGTAYIYYLLKINTKRIEIMSSGTTFKEASGSLMKSLAVLIPPKSIIDNYESSVVDMFNEQELKEQENLCLSDLRDSLLPKLMSGQIKL